MFDVCVQPSIKGLNLLKFIIKKKTNQKKLVTMGTELSKDDLQYKTDQEILDIYNKREKIKASAQQCFNERLQIIRDNGGPRDQSEVTPFEPSGGAVAVPDEPIAKNIVINNCNQCMTLKKEHAAMAIGQLVEIDRKAGKMTEQRAESIKTSVMLCGMGALPKHSSYDVNICVDNAAQQHGITPPEKRDAIEVKKVGTDIVVDMMLFNVDAN